MTPKKAIIIGATSGIGYQVACLLLKEGWTLGIAGRREDRLEAFRQKAPERIYVQRIDILEADADQKLEQLIGRLGGMDLYLHSSGIGFQNASLNPETEIRTLETNGTGFVRMVSAAYRYFRTAGKGHLAIISSVAGTKGLGLAPAYSSEYLPGCTGAVGTPEAPAPGLYRHPPGICGNRPPQQRKALSHADASGGRSTAHCQGLTPQKAHDNHRLALPDTGLFLENDSPLDVETAARENQLTPKANQERNK